MLTVTFLFFLVLALGACIEGSPTYALLFLVFWACICLSSIEKNTRRPPE